MASRINQKQFEKIIVLIKNQRIRNVLYALDRDVPLRYVELLGILQCKTKPAGSYYIRKMKEVGLVIKQDNLYYLGRIGKEIAKFSKKTERLCMEFDLDDCDADGRIKMVIER